MIFDLLKGETNNPHFYDVAISGRVPKPHKQLILLVLGDSKTPTKVQGTPLEYTNDLYESQKFVNRKV